jgi:hypothetical protein
MPRRNEGFIYQTWYFIIRSFFASQAGLEDFMDNIARFQTLHGRSVLIILSQCGRANTCTGARSDATRADPGQLISICRSRKSATLIVLVTPYDECYLPETIILAFHMPPESRQNAKQQTLIQINETRFGVTLITMRQS